jgi:ubiquitin fusion degradation protein 1
VSGCWSPLDLYANISGPKIITPDSLGDTDRKVPAALILPEGKFFFGFKYIPFDPSKAPKKADETEAKPNDPFSGQGNLLKRRRGDATPVPTPSERPAEQVKEEAKEDPWAKLGSGNSLRPKPKTPPPEPPQPTRQEVIDATMLDEDDFWAADDGDEDDVIEIDSD